MVFNEQANARLGDELGIPRGWGRMVVGGAGEASPTFEPLIVWKMVRRLGVLLRLALFTANAERRARAHIAALRARERALSATPPPASLSDRDLLMQKPRILPIVLRSKNERHGRAPGGPRAARGRLSAKDAWKPAGRERPISAALQAYAAMTTSAARGAVRDVNQRRSCSG